MINYTPPTQHTSLFYRSEEEYLEIVIPYLKAGLENNEFCFWGIPETLTVKAAREHLAQSVDGPDDFINKGQLLIINHRDFYLKNGVFSVVKTIESFAAFEARVLEKGFKGIRVTGDGTWALKDNWLQFMMYEKEINQTIHLHKIRALCSYSIGDLELKDICSIGCSHQSSLVKQMGNWNRLNPGRFAQSSIY